MRMEEWAGERAGTPFALGPGDVDDINVINIALLGLVRTTAVQMESIVHLYRVSQNLQPLSHSN